MDVVLTIICPPRRKHSLLFVNDRILTMRTFSRAGYFLSGLKPPRPDFQATTVSHSSWKWLKPAVARGNAFSIIHTRQHEMIESPTPNQLVCPKNFPRLESILKHKISRLNLPSPILTPAEDPAASKSLAENPETLVFLKSQSTNLFLTCKLGS